MACMGSAADLTQPTAVTFDSSRRQHPTPVTIPKEWTGGTGRVGWFSRRDGFLAACRPTGVRDELDSASLSERSANALHCTSIRLGRLELMTEASSWIEVEEAGSWSGGFSLFAFIR